MTELRAEQERLINRQGGLGGGHDDSRESFRVSKRSSAEERQAAADQLIKDWLDLLNKPAAQGSGPAEEARWKLRYLELIERLKGIHPDHWADVIDALESADAHRAVFNSLNVMLLLNPGKLRNMLLDSSESDRCWWERRTMLRYALGSCAEDDPAGMLDWMVANADNYTKLIHDNGKIEVVGVIAKTDPRLALQAISKLGISNTQEALNQIITSMKDNSESRMTKLEAIREFREGTDEELEYDNAYQSIIFGGYEGQANFTQVMDFIESAHMSQDEMEIVVDNMQHSEIEGQEAEWMNWLNEVDVSEKVRSKRVKSMVRVWTMSSPEEASDWMKMAGDDGLRLSALPGYIQALKYRKVDLDAYINSLPRGELRDQAMQYMERN